MEQQTDKMGNVTLTIDEYELHDFFATIYQDVARKFGIDDEEWLEKVVIVQKDGREGYCTEEIRKRWEVKINSLLTLIKTWDGELHDDMEYTCG